MDPSSLLTFSLRAIPEGKQIASILTAALEAVDPAAAVLSWMQRQDSLLTVAGREYDLNTCRQVLLVGAGKAGTPMAHAAAQILGPYLSAGLVIVKEGYGGAPVPDVTIVEAGHPVPDRRGFDATRRLRALLADTTAEDLVICLISGGGSALLTQPAENVTLHDLQELTRALLASGANIREINTLRKHLDEVKGGGLARWAAPAQVITLILSDVVGDPLDVIASGPTAPDPSTFFDAVALLEGYGLQDKAPPAVRRRLSAGCAGQIEETPKPADPLFETVQNIIVGSNYLAAQAAVSTATSAGFHAQLLTTFLEGEAQQAGLFLAALLRQIVTSNQPLKRPACLVVGGETTVTLRGGGLGGRNQELALSAVPSLAALPGVVLAALATDGGDGPTDAAGAVVTGSTLARAQSAGLDPLDFLRRNDAYHFFAPLEDLFLPGPTQTNVNDLTFLFALDI